ncbi:NAD(P)/FAD-dependent oxidoreductase [Sinorhizobium medicae]|uniref:NAD(P)/FAD-dependent oxidoreductase n=1 Tax=Sinorhizobium medicae TaxID=110321 RepID=UPI000FDAE497|nr:tryptophan 7-halogenase [Sinorhizobium medicae]RVP48878.1 hypothetical protein CN078_24035 [Sinorhizobium medicae]RVP73666.1 hypothetical protein CN079_23785 [Sinorhizobium medicae]
MPGVRNVAVAGAGPAGATIARLLALKGWRVSLIDSFSRRLERLEVLAPSSMPLIEALSLGDVLEDPAVARPCLGIRRRWLSTEVEFDDFLRRPPGRGFVVDRRAFDDRLRLLALAAGVERVVGRISAIRREQDIFILDFAGAGVTSLSASLVVDATGRAAALACRLGIERIVKERLVAERRTIDRSDLPQGNAVWLDVQADRDSWNYETYGPDGRRENWTISRHGRRCGASADVANASSTCLAQAAGPGWIAIGDAAAAFDPVASQGLFNALSAAMVAAGIIAERGAVSLDVATDYTAAIISTFLHSERGRTQVYAARSKATSNSESIPNGYRYGAKEYTP